MIERSRPPVRGRKAKEYPEPVARRRAVAIIPLNRSPRKKWKRSEMP